MSKKYQNLTTQELSNINGLLNRVESIIGIEKLRTICDFFKDQHYENHKIPVITPDHYFYIVMDNPFNYYWVGSSKSQKQVESEELQYAPEIEPNEVISCIGVSDSTNKNRIYLVGVYNNIIPSYIEYRNAEKKYNKNTGKFYTRKAGWYFVNNEKEYYAVTKNGEPTNYKKHTCDVPVETVSIFDIQNIREELAMYDAEMERRKLKREEYERQRAEERRKWQEEQEQKEIARKKAKEEYDNFLKDYTYIGTISPGYYGIDSKYEDLVKDYTKWKSIDHHSSFVNSNNPYRGTVYSDTYVNDEHKLYYISVGDSSD